MDNDSKHPGIKSVGWALVQTSRLHRSRTGDKLSELGLFAGQEQVLQALGSSGPMTMGELADQLQASSGAISGATKMLTSVGLAERVPAPASRRDHYRLRDDAWAVLYTNQNAVISAMQTAADSGIAATSSGGLARHRLTQMRDFYAFLLDEIPAVLDRWHQHCDKHTPRTDRHPSAVTDG